jgi:hypothetical protein
MHHRCHRVNTPGGLDLSLHANTSGENIVNMDIPAQVSSYTVIIIEEGVIGLY